MRIALVHPFHWDDVRRGGERYLSDLAWYLARRGHEVDVITGTDGRRGVTDVDGIRIRRIRRLSTGRRGWGPDATHGLLALGPLLRRRYDVVHALTPTAAIAARATGHRAVFTDLGHPTAEWLRSDIGRRRYMAAIRSASAVTALTASAADAVASVAGRRPQVLPAGVRLDRFTADIAPRTGPPRILFMADASEHRKGVDLAIAATVRLRVTLAAVRLQLGGPGSHHWALERLGDQRAAAEAVVDVLGVGRQEDLPQRYRTATVTVLPSTHEALGLALVESLAAGTPVVCSDDSGMREVVDDDRIGRRFPVGDVEALTRALADVVTLAAEPVTPAACRDAATRWGWEEAVGPAHEDLYARVVRGER